MVRLLKTKEVPELVMPEPTALIVIVPEVGAKVLDALSVKVPPTEKEVLY
jgi:hypothetical protein